jgi:hypothetical protein
MYNAFLLEQINPKFLLGCIKTFQNEHRIIGEIIDFNKNASINEFKKLIQIFASDNYLKKEFLFILYFYTNFV